MASGAGVVSASLRFVVPSPCRLGRCHPGPWSPVPVPALSFMTVFRIPPRFPVAGFLFPALLSWAAPNNTRPPRRTAKCCPAVAFHTMSIGIVRFT